MKRPILKIEYDTNDEAFVWTLNFANFRRCGGTLEELKTVLGTAHTTFKEHCEDEQSTTET